MVLLASVLLLHLFVEVPEPDGSPAVTTAAAADTDVRGGTSDVETEGAVEPRPDEEDTSVGRFLARPPRTAGTAGASHAAAGALVRSSVVDRGGTEIRSAGTAERPGAFRAARSAAVLQMFRC